MKTIHRSKFSRDFTTLPNSFLRTKSLSFAAKGILAMMLSHSEEWEMNLQKLADCGFEGRKRIRDAVHELEQSGYAVRQQMMDGTKKFTGTMWTWHDSPVSQGQRSKWVRKPSDRFPSDGIPSDVTPSNQKGFDIKKDHPKENYGKEGKVLKGEKQRGEGANLGWPEEGGLTDEELRSL